jgi:hypothetical protein
MNSQSDSRPGGRSWSPADECRGAGQGGRPWGGGRGWCHGGQGRRREPASLREESYRTERRASLRTVVEDLDRRIRAIESGAGGTTSMNSTDS